MLDFERCPKLPACTNVKIWSFRSTKKTLQKQDPSDPLNRNKYECTTTAPNKDPRPLAPASFEAESLDRNLPHFFSSQGTHLTPVVVSLADMAPEGDGLWLCSKPVS